MAKRSKYGSEYSETTEDDPREDGPDAADTSAGSYGEGSDAETRGPAEEGVGKEEYTVVDPGTVIDGVYFPRADAGAGKEMTAYLDPAQAQALVDNGVVLAQDGVHLEKTPPAPPPEGDEGEEIVA
jgi:hypothetical protein